MLESKQIKNAIALLGVIAIAAVLIILSLEKREAAATPTISVISDNDRQLDELKHPELSDNDNWIEDNSKAGDVLNEDYIRPSYSNDGVLSCDLFLGGTLNIGIYAPENKDYLIINPVYFDSDEDENTSYGIYVAATNGTICYSDAENDSLPTQSCNSYVIKDRTYDTAIPSSYLTCWKLTDGDISTTEAMNTLELRFRVVRFSDYTVVGTAVADIIRDEDQYSLSNLRNSDVLSSGYLSQDNRKELINSAIDFIFDPQKGPSFNTYFTDYRQVMLQMTTVEHCGRPYFNTLLDCNGKQISAGSISNCDLIAVNVPYIGTGSITVYLAPELQAKGFNVSSVFFDNEISYLPAAYDFLYPFTKESLMMP